MYVSYDKLHIVGGDPGVERIYTIIIFRWRFRFSIWSPRKNRF